MIYKSDSGLNEKTKPCGVLHGIVCPHAIRFSKNGELLYVADSASPYMHIFKQQNGEWCSLQKPCKSVRMLDEAAFLSARYNPEEGGVKGIEINYADNILAVTCEQIPMAFYDLDRVVKLPPEQIVDDVSERFASRD